MRFITFILALILPLQVMAGDISAVYDTNDGSSMTISSRGTALVRLDSGPDGYTLMRDDKVYMVSSDGEGGWNVMDMDQMAGMMNMMGSDTDTSNYKAAYVDKGIRERVAGYTGNVYEVTVTDNGKLVSRNESVLSDHADVVQANKAWLALSKRMTRNMGMDMTALLEQADNGLGGLLRHGEDLTLKSISKSPLPSDYFDYPGNAKQVQMGQQAQQADAKQNDTMLEEDAKDIGEAAHDEAKQTTIDEVREGVSGVIESLF